MTRLRGALDRIERFLVGIEAATAGVLLLSMTSLAFVEVLGRNLFHFSLSWSDILLRQGVLWITMIGASLAASDERHVRLDVLAKVIPKKAVAPVRVVTLIFSIVVCGVLARASWVYVVAEKEFGTTLWGEVKAWPFEAILPWGFAVIALKFMIRIFETPPPQGEGLH